MMEMVTGSPPNCSTITYPTLPLPVCAVQDHYGDMVVASLIIILVGFTVYKMYGVWTNTLNFTNVGSWFNPTANVQGSVLRRLSRPQEGSKEETALRRGSEARSAVCVFSNMTKDCHITLSTEIVYV